MTTHRAVTSPGFTHATAAAASASTQAHAVTIGGLIVVAVFAAICISLVSRVSAALAELVTKLIDTTAAVGRSLMLILVCSVLAVVLLIRI